MTQRGQERIGGAIFTIMVVSGALLVADLAKCEQAGPPAPKAWAPVKVEDLADRMALNSAVIGFAFAADMGTTSWALRRCPTCFEAGLGPDVEARVSLHLAYGTAALGACWLLERSGHRGWARAVAIGTAVVFGGAAVSNSIHAIRRSDLRPEAFFRGKLRSSHVTSLGSLVRDRTRGDTLPGPVHFSAEPRRRRA